MRDADSSPLASKAQTPSAAVGRLILAVLVLLAMGRLVTADFSGWDDEQFLATNPVFVAANPLSLLYYWFHPYYTLYAPLTCTVWAMLAWIGRSSTPDDLGIVLNPYVFHAANLLVHVLAGWTAFAVLQKLLGRNWPALIGAMVFVLHPVQVEAVGWASGLKDLLAGLGVLGTLLLYLNAVDHPTKPSRWRFYVAALVVFILALLAKPGAMTGVLLLGAVDLLWFRRPIRAVARWLWLFLVAAGLCAIIARWLQPPAAAAVATPLWSRPLIAAHSLAFYLAKVVWPTNLAFDYGQIPAQLLQHRWIFLAWLIPVACFLVALLAWLRWRSVVPMLALAIFTLAPLATLGLVAFDFQFYSTTADHYLYVSMLGVGLLVGWAAGRLNKATSLALAIGLTAALGWLSFRQSAIWQAPQRFNQHILAVNPRSFGAHTTLAADALRHGDIELAKDHARQAIDLAPNYWRGWSIRGAARASTGDFAGAEVDYRKAVELAPSEPTALTNLGGLLAYRGKTVEARMFMEQAVASDPTNVQARLNLGALLLNSRQPAAAVAQFQEGVKLAPDNVTLRIRYAQALLAMNRQSDAKIQLDAAGAIQPDDAEVRQLRQHLGGR